VTPIDQVRSRPGGRNAQVRQRVFDAVRAALESGQPTELSVERLAARAGVHRVTIYRRWLSAEGVVADLLTYLTPVSTPLPDTGRLDSDMRALITRVASTITEPSVLAMLRLSAGSTDPVLIEAARGYWSSLLQYTAAVIRRAQGRGEATSEIDATDATESALGPLYLRLLVTRQPIDEHFLSTVTARAVRLVRPATPH
jgi:AcrR family transcriptional regulator